MLDNTGSAQRRAAERLSAGIDRALLIVSWVSGLSVVALTLVTLFDVVSRRFFPVNSIGLQEAEWHLHTMLFCCSIGLALVRNRHVRVDIVNSLLPERKRKIIEVLGLLLLLFPVVGVLLWGAIQLVEQSWMFNERSPNSGGLPYRYAIKAFLPLCFTLVILAGISSLIKNFLGLRALGKPVLCPEEAAGSERQDER